MKNKTSDLTFLSFQVDYWDSPWQNRHAFLWELSERFPVFFSSPPFYLPQLIDRSIPQRTSLSSGLERIKPSLYSFVPPRWLPYNYRSQFLDSTCRKIRDQIITAKLKHLQFSQPVMMIWHPRFASMIHRFDHSLTVYYKYDNYAGYLGGDGNSIDPSERSLIENVDIFAVTSHGLKELHREDREDILLLPNGVDYSFFSEESHRQISDEIAAIPQPRIGYVGVINEKVNFELLTEICRKRSSWSIVLVGPVRTSTEPANRALENLRKQPNCHFLGQKEGREVPSYISGLDVTMMCYLVNDWTYYGYPLKMHEYLACGKPVISADLPAVREFKDVVSIPEATADAWIDEIEGLLNPTNRSELREIRQAVAEENSWKNRVDTLANEILKRLDRSD